MNNITIDTIRTYVKELEQKGYSNELIVRKLHATLDFLRWAYHKDFMKYSQFQQLKDEIANFKVKFEASDFHKAENTTPFASIDEDQEKSSVLRSIRSRIPFLNPHHKDSEKKTEGTSSELQNSSLSPRYYIGMAFVVLIIGILGSGIYERFFSTTSKIFAYPSSPSAAARILSFQGRLTDSLGNPITAATNMRFRLYTASSGGSTLYDSGTCSITPDQDGVHNVLIGSECGSEVASSVFTENTQVWLGVTVGSDSEMTPRQRIANVPYAINAETLQGLPVGTEVSNIPYINAGGDLLMAASSPQIGSTYTNQDFLISSARAITIQSAGSGDVTLTATESGTIKFATGGSQHGIITNGGLFGFGTTGPDAKLDVLYTGGEQLRLTYADGSTYTGFTTNSSGDLTIDPSGGDVFLANNDILNIGGSGTDTAYNAIADSVAGASANVNSDNDLYIEGNLEVDGTIYGNVSGTISPGFTQGSIVFADGSGNLAQDNASLYFDDTNNKVGIGTAAPVGNLHVTGAATGKALSIFNETGDQNIITASASGTTVANLDRSGNLAIEGAISDLGGTTLAVNDNLDVSGTLFSGTADAFQVDASGNITTTGDLAVNGDDITGDSNLTINAAGYVRVGDTASPGSANGDDDLFVEGDLEVDGTGYFDGIITQAGGDGSSYAGAVTFNDDVDFTLLGTENVSITNTISGNQSVDLLSVTLTDQTSSAVQRGVVVTKADTTDATTDSLLTIDNAETTANLLTDYLIITKASTGPDTTTDAIDVSDADLGNAINVGANTVVGTTADLDFSNFDITGSTGNITTAGDIAINGGDITSTSTAFKFDIGNTGTLTFRDGTNNLVAIKDQGVYAFLNLSAKTDTGDPASCAEGDIYYNDADDTIKICHESNTWEALDGGAVASQWTDSGTTVYLTDTTDEVVIGGSSPLSSAKFSIDGDADQIQLIVQGNGTQTSNLATFEQSDGTDVLTITNAGNLTTAGDLAVNGDDITGDSNLTINAASYVRVGDTASPGSANGDDDLFVEGDLEIDGVLYTDGGIDTTLTTGSVVFAGTSGVLTQDNANFFWDDTNNKLGLGTTAPDAKFQVTGAATGKALVILNETGDQDIIAASASGVTRFRVANDGTVYGGYFADISNTSYGIDPAGTSNFGGYSLKITGGALLAVDSGNVGIGDSTPDAKLNIQATTEQLRLDYDDSNYTSFTVSSGGDLTIAPTGSDTNVTGNIAISGGTTLGDASGDTVTANAAAWTFANDTTVALSGGVNGINFDSNTLSIDATNNRIGIGTAAPSYQLQSSQTISAPSSATSNIYASITNNTASASLAEIAAITGLSSTSYSSGTDDNAYVGIKGLGQSAATGGTTVGVTGVRGLAQMGNANTTTNLYGGRFGISHDYGTVTNAYGILLDHASLGSTTLTNRYGAYSQNPTGAGTITNNFGFYVAAQTAGGTQDVGIYVADADTYSLQLASTDGDAASGITFGTDTNLYRSAADTLKTDDAFFAVGNITTSGDLAVNGNDITSSSNLTLNATGYTRIGDTASPGSATGDDDLFVESDIELDGVLYLDGTIDTTFTAGSVVFAGTSGVLAEDNTNFFFNDSTNKLGLGDTTPDAFLDITGTTEQLRLSYETGDTNYASFTLSSGGDLTIAPTGGDLALTGDVDISDQFAAGPNGAITANIIGHIAYNTVPVNTDGTYGVYLGQTTTGSGSSSQSHYGLYNYLADNSSSTGNIGMTGIKSDLYMQNGAVGGNATWKNISGYLKNESNGGTNNGALYNFHALAQNAGTTTWAAATNYYSGYTNTGAATASTLYNFFADTPTNASGTITTAYGMYVADQSVGTNTTAYGLYIANQSGSSGNAIGLYIADADDYSIQLASTDGDAASGITFGTDTNLYRSAANTLKTDDGLLVTGTTGIGTTGPDAKLDVLSTTEQLRLTYADGSTYSSFTVDSSGDLTIAPSGGDTKVTGTLAASSILQVGSATATTYSRFGTNSTGHSLSGAGSALISGDLEVDGTLYADGAITAVGTVTGGDFSCTDCLDFAELEDTLDLDAALTLNQSTNTWTQNFTGTTGTTGYTYNADSLTTGTGILSSFDALTSGIGHSITSTSTALSSGNLLSLDWSPGSATTATGDLVKINIGTNGNVGNLLNVTDTSSSLFRVAESQIESAVPHAFTAPGDVSIAYDLLFSNQTASYIKSNAPLYVEAGETFESNNLTLRAYNSGDIILDLGSGNVVADGNILPTADDTYNLGSNTYRWADAFLGGETIHIGTSTSDEATLGYTTSSNLFNVTNSYGNIQLTSGTVVLSGTTTLTASSLTALNCSDCTDFDDLEDTLDLDAALTLNQSTNTWTQNFTGTTADGLTYNGNSLTSGNLIKLSSTSTSFTSGAFINADWSPGSSTTNSGDLLKINTGTNGNLTGNYINLLKGSSTLFKVAGGNGNVTTEGDLAINGGDITSSAALNIDVNTNITTPDTLTVGSATAGVGVFNATGATTGKALAILNATGDQNILSASASGSNRFLIGNNGDISRGNSHGVNGLPGSDNMVPNGGFEVFVAGGTLPDDWAASAGTVTKDASSYKQGAFSIQLGTTGSSAIQSTCFPVTHANTYRLTGWAICSGITCTNNLSGAVVQYSTRANCESETNGNANAQSSSPTSSWGNFTGTGNYTIGNDSAAVNAKWARVKLINTSVTNTINIDAVRLNPSGLTVGLDVAETYPAAAADHIQLGEIVAFGTNNKQIGADVKNIERSSKAYDHLAFGVVATKPGLILDDDKQYEKVNIALKGRVPVLVTTENGPIKIGDPITASSKPGVGMKATRSGKIIGYAMTEWTSSDPNEVDQVTVFVNPETYVDLSILTSLQESVAKFPALTASALSRADDIVINTADALLITTEKLVAQSITSVNATIDNLVVDRIASREIKAKTVNTETLEAQKITTDNLVAQDVEGKDASFSGKLVAQEIDADNIRELRQRLEKLSAEQADEPEFNSEQLQSEVENIQQYLNNMPDQATQTNLPINEITSNTSIDPGTSTSITGDVISLLNVEKLTVTGEAVMTSLVVADSFTAGNIFVKDNTILSLNNELKLSALENISLMDGAVMIAKNGTITAKGEVIAEKGVRTNTIKGLDTNNPIGVQLSQNKVEVLNNDNVVAAIDEKGSAKFKDVSVDTYTDATSSAAIIAAEDNYEENGILSPAIQTNAAAAGNGILPAKNDTVVIYNEKIGPKSLVYVTATSKTYNHNLYVAEKKSCTPEEKLEDNCKPYFTVHIDGVVKDAISFNWSIVN